MAVYQKLSQSLHVDGHLGCYKFDTIMNNEIYEHLYAKVYPISVSPWENSLEWNCWLIQLVYMYFLLRALVLQCCVPHQCEGCCSNI